MLKTKDILDEKNKILRTVSEEVTFPLSDDDLKTIDEMIEYLTNSQIESLAEKYDLRPGMGLAAIQLGIPKRYLTIVHEVDEQEFDNYIVINPKIVSTSQEKIYVEDGEGCLSVNRDVEGHVPRYARVTIHGFDTDGNEISIRAREELSIAFQPKPHTKTKQRNQSQINLLRMLFATLSKASWRFTSLKIIKRQKSFQIRF